MFERKVRRGKGAMRTSRSAEKWERDSKFCVQCYLSLPIEKPWF